MFTLNIYIRSERNKLNVNKAVLENQSPEKKSSGVSSSQNNKSSSPSRFRRKVVNDELQPPSCALFGGYLAEIDSSKSHPALIGTVTRHLAGALNGVAECLKEGRVVDIAVGLEIEQAAESIAEMDERRQHQRLAFGEVAMTTLEADCKGEWVEKHLDFKSALGVSPSTFLKLSQSDQIAYWDAYWLQRDRISTSSVTLTTLKESLLNLCTLAGKLSKGLGFKV